MTFDHILRIEYIHPKTQSLVSRALISSLLIGASDNSNLLPAPQVHTLCEDNPCKNKATCDVTINGDTEVVCSCPLGYQGATCEDRIDVEVGQPEHGTWSRDPGTHSHWSGAALLRVQLAAAAAGGRGQRETRHRARDGGHIYLVIYICIYTLHL